MAKGLDSKFLHYGIRMEDLSLIRTLCVNNIYEQLPKQAMNEDYVQIRHFTIIDEADWLPRIFSLSFLWHSQ